MVVSNAILTEEVIGQVDELINRQLNRILHHDSFQQLEAAWRGVALLTQSVEKTHRVRVRYLPLSIKELAKDLGSVSEFDQSQLFKKVYSEQLDQPGGEPFGLLIGDYYLKHTVKGQKVDAMQMLRQVANVCAAAFVPFVTSVSPEFFELDGFSQLQPTFNIDRLLKTEEYHRWHKLRREENAHFIGLTLPRVLIRQPYNANGVRLSQRSFKETLLSHSDYLWGNACYAYATIVIKSFEQTGWFMNMRGVGQEEIASEQLNVIRDRFISNKNALSEKIITEFLVTDSQEKKLNDIGLIALRDHRLAKRAVFYSSQSIKLPKRSANEADFTQTRINTMLHYVLCASRFAHYIKVIIRDKIGSFTNVEDCETFMTQWLSQYCSSAKGQSLVSIMKNPLTAADVNVKEITGNPGKYYCAMSISPHSQFDDIQSQLKLVTNVKL